MNRLFFFFFFFLSKVLLYFFIACSINAFKLQVYKISRLKIEYRLAFLFHNFIFTRVTILLYYSSRYRRYYYYYYCHHI